MSTTVAEELEPDSEDQASNSSMIAWIALLAGLAAVVGALAAVFWSGVVDLPSYTIQPDGSASIGEHGLGQFVAADVWYAITGAVVGSGLGLVVWKWFHSAGWPVAVLAVAAGLLAGVVCWQLGELIGPGAFNDRVAKAQAGDLVPIALELRSLSALAVWGFAAITPVLLISSLGPDEEDAKIDRRAEPVPEPEPTDEVDELGVLTVKEP